MIFRKMHNRLEEGEKSGYQYEMQADIYYHVRGWFEGKKEDFLFTEKELAVAMKRADKNPADIPRNRIFAWWWKWISFPYRFWRKKK